MYHAHFGAGREVHEGFFVVESAVCAIAFGAESLLNGELGMEFLQAGFAEGGKGEIAFEGGEDGIFGVRVEGGGAAGIKDMSDVGIEGGHDTRCC